MEEVQYQQQQRIIARAGRRTAERARRIRVTGWKSPSKGLEKQLFADDVENCPPSDDATTSPKNHQKNKKKEVKLKKSTSFKVQASNEQSTPKVKKMPSVRTPANELRDKRKAKTPLSAKSTNSSNTSPQSETETRRMVTKSKNTSSPPMCSNKNVNKKNMKASITMISSPSSPFINNTDNSSPPMSPHTDSDEIIQKETTSMKKKFSNNNSVNHFVSPNTFLKRHPYPNRYRGMTPGTTSSPANQSHVGSECDSEWNDAIDQSISDFGDLSINDSYANDDDEEPDDDDRLNDSVSSLNSVKSGKWCKR